MDVQKLTFGSYNVKHYNGVAYEAVREIFQDVLFCYFKKHGYMTKSLKINSKVILKMLNAYMQIKMIKEL